MKEAPAYFHFWAKTQSLQSQNIHPLIYHLIDVGATCQVLWNEGLGTGSRQMIAGALGLSRAEAGQLLAFWASLHDLGKAAPGFQRKFDPAVPKLKAVGFRFPAPNPEPAPHGQVSAYLLEKLLPEVPGHTAFIAKKVARALGGHHGSWPVPGSLLRIDRQEADRGDQSWEGARREILQALREVFNPPALFSFPEDPREQNALLTLLSGLVSVADWIGSMAERFPFEQSFMPLQDYARRALGQARQALAELGWLGWQPDGQLHLFEELFPFPPHAAQQAAIQAAADVPMPALVILEAPTGSGKTETALFLADHWLQQQLGQGIYVAMPTMATSNQMHGRVQKFLEQRYPGQSINYQLVHGGALLQESDLEPAPVDIADEENAPSLGQVRAQGWFLPRKRSLLAPFGVGTVDQALLSVLQTKHFFVRLFGLGRKVVIFDEVHAYDTYMNTLFERLLTWLRSIGTSVVILSATLPQSTRQKLAAAWLGQPLALAETPYPRLTLVTNREAQCTPLPAPKLRQIKLHNLPGDPASLITFLRQKLAHGGCAAVVCNRVARAQEVYRALKQAEIIPEAENLILFHARFPFAWREQIEQTVLHRFSKGGDRPEKAIVVATQVIEQSLDLDFDLMISDLAPVDLLIQRAGRLHRHASNDPRRPGALQVPTLAICQPAVERDLPEFGADTRIYERETLLRTWLALRGKEHLTLPADTAPLIEQVYSDQPLSDEPELIKALEEAHKESEQAKQNEKREARDRLISSPEDEELLNSRNENLDEENPTIHQAFRALTRLSDPSVELICLHQKDGCLRLGPDDRSSRVDLETKPNRQLVRALLRHAVSVQHWEVVRHFQDQRTAPAWREIAALRYHFPVIFDAQGNCPLEGSSYTLHLDRETGLEIRKEPR